MRCKFIRLFVIAWALSALGAASLMAQNVLPGFDLLQTQSGTTFAGVPFVGVPLNTYNFGGTIGVRNVGNADTIVQRLQTANAPSQIIPIQMVALQLMSAVPVDFGLGLGFYFITLQSVRGGPATTGQMTINFGPNTFSSFFDVFFDVRLGSLNGPIALSTDLVLTNTSTMWTRTPPTGAAIIDGVNHNLNGTSTASDFWPVGPFTEQHPTGAIHVVNTATAPEQTSTLALMGLSALSLLWFRRRARA